MGHDWWDLIVMCGLLALNIRGAIHGIREHDDVAQSLEWSSSIRAIVLREGKIAEVAIKELVPGDIVHVSEVCCLSYCLCPSRNLITTTAHIDTRRRSHNRNGQHPSYRPIKHHR